MQHLWAGAVLVLGGLVTLLRPGLGAAASPMDTACVWRSSISATLPHEQEVTPRPGCESGELHWYQPRGLLRSHFRHESSGTDFRLCLASGPDDHVTTLYNTTGLDLLPLLPPTQRRMTCLNSISGVVGILFDAPKEKHHVTVVKYHIRPP